MPTEMELVLEQTQQGTSYEVSKLVNTSAVKIHKDDTDNKDWISLDPYEHVGPEVTRSQEGKRSQDDDKRLCLVDDLKEVQDSHNKSSLLEQAQA
ncbi:hypothetical protein Tco_0531053 [Tanacetum coccineum]